MKIILIDNNDSFTYNIVNLVNGIDGIDLDVVPHYNIKLNELVKYDRIIFSPGPSLPEDYPIMFQILKEFVGKIPILGICLGHQAICIYYGARLERLTKVVHGERTLIHCVSDSKLFNGIEQMYVGRYHSWVAQELPNTGLKVVAQDASNIIMAVEDSEKKIFGVQFHPESYMSQNGLLILKNFIYGV